MFLTFYFFVLGGPFCGNADIQNFRGPSVQLPLRRFRNKILGKIFVHARMLPYAKRCLSLTKNMRFATLVTT